MQHKYKHTKKNYSEIFELGNYRPISVLNSVATLETVNDIYCAIDEGSIATGLFTFDKVNQKILVEKFEHAGVRGIALQLFKSYLSYRYQFVNVQGRDSDT